MNTKETLKRLHKKFPMMGLDELFEVLDCYVEESKIWYTDYTVNTMPLKTNGIEFNKNSISCPTSNKIDIQYDTTTTAKPSSVQLTTSH